MVDSDTLGEIIDVLKELQDDSTVSKNIKLKVSSMQKDLENAKGDDVSLKVNKILCELDEISNDVNLPMIVRTQIWHITSMLETVC